MRRIFFTATLLWDKFFWCASSCSVPPDAEFFRKAGEYGSSHFLVPVLWESGFIREYFMADIKYEIKEHIGVLSENAKGWRKEVNLISWNDAAPKYDIRAWAPEHEKMGKGVTLTASEVGALKEVLAKIPG